VSAIAAGAFGLGFALGAAPGPVQLLILSETSRGGFARGLRVMLGANGTLFVVLLALAFGLSRIEPGEAALDVLRVAGGGFLIYLGVVELRGVLAAAPVTTGEAGRRELGPTARGVVSVILNPGAWIFFGTTATAVVAQATATQGRDAALLAAAAMTLGVSCSDLTFSLLGSGGRRLVGDRGLRWIRAGLAVALAGIGVWFVLEGPAGPTSA
jgi:threonine/homoserine/homoserine lactone efflux protein